METIVTDQNPDDAVISSAETENTDANEQRIPKSRFDEVNNRAKAAERKLAQLEAAEAQRLEQEQLAKGEHQKVIDALKPKAERAEALEAALQTYYEAELAGVPEDKRGLIPDGDVTTRLDWLKKAKTAGLFGLPKAPDLDAGAQGDRTKTAPLSNEERQMMAASGMTEKDWRETQARMRAQANIRASIPGALVQGKE